MIKDFLGADSIDEWRPQSTVLRWGGEGGSDSGGGIGSDAAAGGYDSYSSGSEPGWTSYSDSSSDSFSSAANDAFQSAFESGNAGVAFTDGSQSFGNFLDGGNASFNDGGNAWSSNGNFDGFSGSGVSFTDGSSQFGSSFNSGPDFNATFSSFDAPSGMDLAGDFGQFSNAAFLGGPDFNATFESFPAVSGMDLAGDFGNGAFRGGSLLDSALPTVPAWAQNAPGLETLSSRDAWMRGEPAWAQNQPGPGVLLSPSAWIKGADPNPIVDVSQLNPANLISPTSPRGMPWGNANAMPPALAYQLDAERAANQPDLASQLGIMDIGGRAPSLYGPGEGLNAAGIQGMPGTQSGPALSAPAGTSAPAGAPPTLSPDAPGTGALSPGGPGTGALSPGGIGSDYAASPSAEGAGRGVAQEGGGQPQAQSITLGDIANAVYGPETAGPWMTPGGNVYGGPTFSLGEIQSAVYGSPFSPGAPGGVFNAPPTTEAQSYNPAGPDSRPGSQHYGPAATGNAQTVTAQVAEGLAKAAEAGRSATTFPELAKAAEAGRSATTFPELARAAEAGTFPVGHGQIQDRSNDRGIQLQQDPNTGQLINPRVPAEIRSDVIPFGIPSLNDVLRAINPISTAEARSRSRSENRGARGNEPNVPGAPPIGSPGRASPEQLQQTLQQQRSDVAQELAGKPGLKEALFRRAFTEVGNNPARVQAWLESILNRVEAETRFGRTLEGALRGEYNDHPGGGPFGSKQGGYFPGTGGENSRTMTNNEFRRNARNELAYDRNGTLEKIAPLFDQLLNNVLRGSNTALLSTGNASKTTGVGILQTRIGGEKYGIETYKGALDWARSTLAAPPGRGIGSDIVVAGRAAGAPAAAKPPVDLPPTDMPAQPLAGLPPPAVLESLMPTPYQGREGTEAEYGRNYGREAQQGRDSYPSWLTNIAEASQGQPYGNPTAGIPAPPTVTAPGGWTAGVNQAYGPFGDQSREGTNEYGQNYGRPDAVTGPYQTAESDYGYNYGAGPTAETGPHQTADADYGVNYGGGPPAVGALAPGWLASQQQEGATKGTFEDVAAPGWVAGQQTAGVTSGVFTNPGQMAAQTLQDVGAPAGVAQAVSNAIEVAQINGATPAQVAEVAYQTAKDAGATEVQAETAAQVALEAAQAQEVLAEPDSKGDLIAAPFDSRFGEWDAPVTMTSTFGPDEAGMFNAGKGDLVATPFDARFGEWQAPVEVASKDSFDSRFGEWRAPEAQAPAVASRGIGSDWGATRGADPGLAPSLAAIAKSTPDARPAMTSVINNLPVDQRGPMLEGMKNMSNQDIAALLSKGPNAVIDLMAKGAAEKGYSRGQVESWLNNWFSSIGYPGYPGGIAQLGKDMQAANQQAIANAIPGRASTQFQDPSVVANVQDMGFPGWQQATGVASKPGVDLQTMDMPTTTQSLPEVTVETTAPAQSTPAATAPSQSVPGGPPAGGSTQVAQEVLSNPQSAAIVHDIAASYGVDIGTAALIYRLFFVDTNIPEDAFVRAMKDGGRPYVGETVLVGEEGPEFFVPDVPGTIVPYVPQGGMGGGGWPKAPTPDIPGKVAGYGRELQMQRRRAQEAEGDIMRLIDSGVLRLNEKNWENFLKAQKPSKNIEDRRGEKD